MKAIWRSIILFFLLPYMEIQMRGAMKFVVWAFVCGFAGGYLVK